MLIYTMQWHYPSLDKSSIYKRRNASLGDALEGFALVEKVFPWTIHPKIKIIQQPKRAKKARGKQQFSSMTNDFKDQL